MLDKPGDIVGEIHNVQLHADLRRTLDCGRDVEKRAVEGYGLHLASLVAQKAYGENAVKSARKEGEPPSRATFPHNGVFRIHTMRKCLQSNLPETGGKPSVVGRLRQRADGSVEPFVAIEDFGIFKNRRPKIAIAEKLAYGGEDFFDIGVATGLI